MSAGGNRTIDRERLIKVLNELDLFDEEYYSSRYMSGEASRLDAVKHFADHMDMDFRSPTPLFDTWAYLNGNPDVRSGGMNAFIHYNAFGREEGRRAPSLEHPNYREAYTINELCSLPNIIGGVKLAISIHLYYEDFLPELSKRLRSFPYPFDLFVSVRNEHVKSQAEQAFSSFKKGEVTVEVVQNRGRNIAPLIVQFGKRLREYDLVGHVHTKKSLYTGEEKRAWNDHCFAGVLGSPDFVEGIIKKFSNDPEVQIVSAELFYEMPFWALHELSNAAKLRMLEHRLGMESGEFIDYPVGGMFWTRGTLLDQIVKLELKYEDFDEEHGQIDGTLHHAIERVVGKLASRGGGKSLKYSPRYGVLYADEDQWFRLYERQRLADVTAALENADVVSFDFFDTLVCRNASDVEEAKIRLSEELFSIKFPDGKTYQEFRNEAELKAREVKNWQGDVGYLEIAKAMTTDDFTFVQVLSWLRREAEIDLDLFVPRKVFCNHYRSLVERGRRVVIVSDTFYSRAFICKALGTLGLPEPSALYLSSETGYRKDRGDLWEFVRAIEVGRICHVGDNIVSDIQKATEAGVSAFFAAKIIDKARWLGVLKMHPRRQHWHLVAQSVLAFGDDPFFA